LGERQPQQSRIESRLVGKQSDNLSGAPFVEKKIGIGRQEIGGWLQRCERFCEIAVGSFALSEPCSDLGQNGQRPLALLRRGAAPLGEKPIEQVKRFARASGKTRHLAKTGYREQLVPGPRKR